MEPGDGPDNDESEPARLPDGGPGAGPVDNGPSPENPPDPEPEPESQQSGNFMDGATGDQESLPPRSTQEDLCRAPSRTTSCCGWKTANWNRKTTNWTWKSNPSRSSCSKAAARGKA